jgi:SHS2 domain-containing protein
MKAGYKILEHPADMGIEAYGKNLKEAFEQSAIALLSIILDTSNIEAAKIKLVEIHASDYEQLLVNWLTEILYLYDGDHYVAEKFEINTLTKEYLNATIGGEKFNNAKHPTKMDVKAITYHQILIQENEEGGLVRVFIDI